MSMRALMLGLLLVVSGQGYCVEHRQGPDDFHMGPVPNVHEEGDDNHDDDNH